jgi:hypothetical protein
MEETNNKVGAPLGNKNSIKSNRLWAETIRRAVVQDDSQRLRQIAEALLIKASEGDMAAIKELGDRLDGKALQENKLTGDSDQPIEIKIVTGIE